MVINEQSLKSFANIIVVERAKKRWSQTKLANESGVAVSTLNGIESGRIKKCTASTLFKIANALNIDEQDVIELFNL